MKFTDGVDVSLFAREHQQAPPPSEPARPRTPPQAPGLRHLAQVILPLA
jgi:hypothetical protein